MNSNRVNGTIDDVVGSVKHKAGKLTGYTPLQVRGAVQQVKGQLQNAVGKVQEAVDGTGVRANPPRKTRS